MPIALADRILKHLKELGYLKTGDKISVDLDAARITVLATGKKIAFKPLGEVRPVVDAGGLFNFARKSGMIAARA